MDAKDKARILKFLARGPALPRRGRNLERLLLEGGERGTIEVARAALQEAIRSDLVEARGNRIVLSDAGRAHLRRGAAGDDPFQGQHRDISAAQVKTCAGPQRVLVNDAESPLTALARRKSRSGVPFLTGQEVRAGERLRADYTRGQLMPRLGANWQAAVSSGRRDGERGIAELTDAALGARMRVEKALQAVGPELSGVLVDICCFLKGLETVEAERGWPVRSGKVVLKAALGALGRHYWPPASAADKSHPHGEILHWGAQDYRPSLG